MILGREIAESNAFIRATHLSDYCIGGSQQPSPSLHSARYNFALARKGAGTTQAGRRDEKANNRPEGNAKQTQSVEGKAGQFEPCGEACRCVTPRFRRCLCAETAAEEAAGGRDNVRSGSSDLAASQSCRCQRYVPPCDCEILSLEFMCRMSTGRGQLAIRLCDTLAPTFARIESEIRSEVGKTAYSPCPNYPVLRFCCTVKMNLR